jgi:hypothetical protein
MGGLHRDKKKIEKQEQKEKKKERKHTNQKTTKPTIQRKFINDPWKIMQLRTSPYAYLCCAHVGG